MFKQTNTGRTEEKQENVKNDKNETVNKQTQEKENTNKNKEKVFWRTQETVRELYRRERQKSTEKKQYTQGSCTVEQTTHSMKCQ